MNLAELAAHDLKLLVALHVLLRERHVSRAADRLGMSQPAMSRSLSRLREMFGDPLLVRSKYGMEPTPLALELYPKAETVIEGLRSLVGSASADLRTASRTFRVAAPDIVTYILAPALMEILREAAPGVDVEITPWSPQWHDMLERGAIDLGVGVPSGEEPGIYARPLLEVRWICALREGHPVLDHAWTVEHYAGLSHLQISPGQGGGAIDRALAERGLSRRIALKVPYPVLAPLLIAETDLVLTTHEWLARRIAGPMGLVLRPLPLEVPPTCVSMIWHERCHGDPIHQWLRQTIARLAGERTQA